MFTRLAVLAALLCVGAAGCGKNRYVEGAAELKPEYYVIDENDRPAEEEHMRFAKPGPRGGGLDIAVTEYVHPEPGKARVTLFGVVHVADAHYFDEVQRALDTYDIVLWEGVKPAAMSATEWQKKYYTQAGDAAYLQKMLIGWFGFEYQLDGIDYGRPNLVHADMSMEEFTAAGGDKLIPGLPELGGDDDDDSSEEAEELDMASLPSRVRETWETVKKIGDTFLGEASPLRSMARRLFAETMGEQDIGRTLEMYPEFSELILDRRNDVVMEKLKEILPEATGSIAVFYGAAHMPDLERRLIDVLGYERGTARWLRAWAVRPPLTD